MKRTILYSIVTLATIVSATFSANAQNTPSPSETPKGFVFSKNAVQTADGGYNLVIEAFETGESSIIPQPVDIVLMLDNSASLSSTQLSTLKSAAKKFVETVYNAGKNLGSGVYHKISIFTFHEHVDYLTTKETLVDLDQALYNNLTKNGGLIDGISTDPQTYSDLAFKNAQTVLDKYKTDGRKKVVVFFTDGVPCDNGDNTFNSRKAKDAVNTSYYLKSTAGIEAAVYSIAILESETSYVGSRSSNKGGNRRDSGTTPVLTNDNSRTHYTLDTRRFLNYISSNYNFEIKDGTKISGTFNGSTAFDEQGKYRFTQNYPNANGGDEQSQGYYQLVDLNTIVNTFKNIAEEATSGGAAYTFDTKTTEVKDVMITGDFELPANAVSKIIVKKIACSKISGTSGNYSYEFNGTQTTLSNVVSVDGKTIKVTGFDFSSNDEYNSDNTAITSGGNWVGPRKDKSGNLFSWKGNKLQITIPIVLNDDYNGGYEIYTNTGESGVYEIKNGVQKFYPFTNPTINLPTLAIAKKGLANGESAVFTVAKTGGQTFTVALTGNGNEWVYTILKGLPYGTYTVSESNWSWTYNDQTTSYTVEFSAEGVTGASFATNYDYTKYGIAKPAGKYVILPFENTKDNNITVKNGENIVNNNFKTNTSTNPTTKATE